MKPLQQKLFCALYLNTVDCCLLESLAVVYNSHIAVVLHLHYTIITLRSVLDCHCVMLRTSYKSQKSRCEEKEKMTKIQMCVHRERALFQKNRLDPDHSPFKSPDRFPSVSTSSWVSRLVDKPRDWLTPSNTTSGPTNVLRFPRNQLSPMNKSAPTAMTLK